MISIFRKKEPTTLTVELTKSFVLSSVVDNFTNNLIFPGDVSVTMQGIQDKSVVKWSLKNITTGQDFGEFFGEQMLKKMPIGEYQIKFFSISKHITPSPQIKKLTERGSIAFNGNYVRSTGDLEIVLSSNLKTFNKNLAKWTLTSNNSGFVFNGQNEKLFVDLDPVNYEVIFNSIDGFQTPENVFVKIESNKSKSVVGIYNVECSATGSLTGTCFGPRNLQFYFNFDYPSVTGSNTPDLTNVVGRIKNLDTGCVVEFTGPFRADMLLDGDFKFPSGKILLEFDNFDLNFYKKDIFMTLNGQRYYEDEMVFDNIITADGDFLVMVFRFGSNVGVRP